LCFIPPSIYRTLTYQIQVGALGTAFQPKGSTRRRIHDKLMQEMNIPSGGTFLASRCHSDCRTKIESKGKRFNCRPTEYTGTARNVLVPQASAISPRERRVGDRSSGSVEHMPKSMVVKEIERYDYYLARRTLDETGGACSGPRSLKRPRYLVTLHRR
jgi:hypothetical protein